MMDASSEQILNKVYPRLGEAARGMEVQIGEPLSVVQGFRLWADQDKLWNQGRATPGKIVTNSPPGHSWHEFGLAIDLVPKSLLSEPNWAPKDPLWAEMVMVGESLGLFPGARFSHPDLPHYQMTGKFGLSPTNEVRDLFKLGGLLAVWEAAFR